MDYLQYIGEYGRVIYNTIKVGFKPYYKWITFNTKNLKKQKCLKVYQVLNLIINGLPSILTEEFNRKDFNLGFKPYYKWITFNTYGSIYIFSNYK